MGYDRIVPEKGSLQYEARMTAELNPDLHAAGDLNGVRMNASVCTTEETERKMFFFERLMYVDGRTPVNCVMALRLNGAVSATNLHTALDKVQARHPLLRIRVSARERHPSFIFQSTPGPIPMRVVERKSDEDWNTELLKEWHTPFRLECEPPIRLVWLCSKDISELLLTSHHCVSDGASLITIFREILAVTDQPRLELAPYPPILSLDELLPQKERVADKAGLGILAKVALFRLFALTIRTAQRVEPGEHYLLYWRADADASARLASRCREEQTTPYAAMCVAFLTAFRRVMGRRFKNKMMCPVNVRRFTRNLGADQMFNYAPTVPLSLARDPDQNFWSMARRLKRSISDKVAGLDALEHLIMAERLHASVQKLISLLLRSKTSYDCAFSNVGRLEIPDGYAAFRVEECLGVTAALPWRNATTLVTSQFRGQTDVAFVADEKFLPRHEAIAIQQRAIETLTAALDGE